MRIESKLNEKFFRKSQKINLNFVFGKKLKNVKQNLIMLFFLFIICLQMISKDIILGYILLGFGLMFLINIIWFYNSYFKIKKQHFKNIETEILHYKNNPEKIIISEFRNDNFYYKDYKMEFTLIWEKFEGFKIIDNYLVLKSFGANYLNFFFNRDEITSEDFDKIIMIVRNNIKNKK